MSQAALAVPRSPTPLPSPLPLPSAPRPWLLWRIHFEGQRDRPRPAIGGGQLLTTTWSASAFVRLRRLAGIRFKLLAMFAAEVVGIRFYGALAERLPAGSLRAALEEIARDERGHLAFHRWSFLVQAPQGGLWSLVLDGAR